VITREIARRARRPIAGSLLLETMTSAYQEVQHRAGDLSVNTTQERNFAEGYTQALKDFARETGERQEALRHRQARPVS